LRIAAGILQENTILPAVEADGFLLNVQGFCMFIKSQLD